MDLGVEQLWSVELGESPAGSMLAFSELLLAPAQGSEQPAQSSTLHALSLQDGSLCWQKRFECALVSGLALVRAGEGAESSPVLLALSSTDLIHGEGALLALDSQGELCWRWPDRPSVQRVSAPAVENETACFIADARTFIALDPLSGRESARAELSASAAMAAPAMVNGVAYVPCRGPHLLAVGIDGKALWRFEAGGAAETNWLDKTPVVVGELVLAVQSDGSVLALRIRDGSLAWQVDVGPSRKRLSPPVTDGRALYVGARDGLHALDPADGHELWAFPTPLRIEAAPAVAGGVLYAACYDHHLYALDASSGHELWRCPVGEQRIEAAPLVAACAGLAKICVVAASRDGTLSAIACSMAERPSFPASDRTAPILIEASPPCGPARLDLAAHQPAIPPAAPALTDPSRLADEASRLEARGELLKAAEMWGAAAATFEAEGEREQAQDCRREAARLLREPIITMDVQHEGLVLEAWSRLRFSVRNEGYGPARKLIIHARGEQFEGQVAVTRQIVTLHAGRERVDWLDIRPRQYGSSVPLRVSVDYFDQANKPHSCRQTIYLPVARSVETRSEGQSIHLNMSGGVAIIGRDVSVGGDVVGGDQHHSGT
jgi:outer membrane protein assembly factor BamB